MVNVTIYGSTMDPMGMDATPSHFKSIFMRLYGGRARINMDFSHRSCGTLFSETHVVDV